MTTAESWLALIAAIGGALAAVIYIGGQIRKLARAVEQWGDLPGQYRELRSVTARNTLAIESLTKEVAALRQVEQRRADGS